MVQTALIVLIIIIPVIRVNSVNETYSQIVAATTTLLKLAKREEFYKVQIKKEML